VPRIGMEVVVSFLEGDPDQPLVTGCVYNGDSMPPYPLPDEQTKATIKSNSSKGGGGFNELRFEDKKGSEEIFVQAEKDCKRLVKHDDTLDVGNNQTVTIKGDQKVTVSKTIVVEATTSIELKVGSSSIKIEPAKITLKSTEIAIEAEAAAEVKAGATMTVKAGAPMSIKSDAIVTVEGALVKIN
jgi:type VI secretion system secreted protein VgrG